MIRYFGLALLLTILIRIASKISEQPGWNRSTQNIIFKTLFKLLKSNHLRREIGNNILLKHNLRKLLNFQPLDFNVVDDIHSYTPLLLRKYSKNASDIYFAGDSHIEFLSRVSATDNKPLNFRSHGIWLGPKTLTGLYYDGSIDAQVKKIVEYLYVVHTKSWENTPSLCAISIGNIDIRCFFHQALVFRLVKNENALLDVFQKAADKFFGSAAKNILANFPSMKFGIVEILYCNNAEGYSGNDRKLIRKLLKKEGFPTLGSIKNRIRWTNQINKILMEICKKNNYLYIETNKFLRASISKQVLSPEVSVDGAHLTNLSVLNNIQNNANSKISNRFD
jgi:hypothetical protein